jgi:hypothetical protein
LLPSMINVPSWPSAARAKSRGDVTAEESNGGGASEPQVFKSEGDCATVGSNNWNSTASSRNQTGGTDRWLRRKSPW